MGPGRLEPKTRAGGAAPPFGDGNAASGDGLGALGVQEMADAVDGELLDVSERGAQEVRDLDPERLGLGPEDRQEGLVDHDRLLGPNFH
jgi:hypothetical protein